MSDTFIEVTPGTGLKIDAEGLTVNSENVVRERVQVAGAADVEIAEVSNAFIPTENQGIGVRPISQRSSSIQTFIASTVLDDTPTEVSGTLTGSEDAKAALLYLAITRSASPPTSLTFQVEISDDAGTDWFECPELTQVFSDMNLIPTTGAYRVAIYVPYLGRDTRVRLIGTGTGTTETFTVVLTGELLG